MNIGNTALHNGAETANVSDVVPGDVPKDTAMKASMMQQTAIDGLKAGLNKGTSTASKKLIKENTNHIAAMLEQELNGMSADQIAKTAQKLNRGFVISMNSRFKRWWDVVVALATIYVAIVTPVQVGFELMVDGYEALETIQIFVDTLFIVEAILTFRTSYIDSATREEIYDIAMITRHYLYGWFVLDVASSYPTSWFPGQSSSVHALKILRIIKIFRVFQLSTSPLFVNLTAYVSRKINPALLRMFKLACIFVLSQHYMACSYYYVVSYEGITNQTWNPPFAFNDTLTDKYVGAFYFAIMVTTANDLGPRNTLERVFTGLMLLIGIGINASIIGSAANLLANMDKTEVARKEHLDAINDYLRFKKIPLLLQEKIRHYYDYVWTIRPSEHASSQLFAELPDRLKLQLTLSLHRDFINKVPLFKALSPGGTIAVVQCMERVVAMPNDLIIREGETGDEFYFINSGSVEIDIIVKKNKVKLGVLGSGSYFGEIALLTNQPRSANVRATFFCELNMIRKDDFHAIVQSFPQFHIALKKISDSRQQTAINMQKMSKLMKSDAQVTTSDQKTSGISLGLIFKVLQLRRKAGKVLTAADNEKTSAKPSVFDSVLDDEFILNMSQAEARNITNMKKISVDLFTSDVNSGDA